MEDFQPVPFTVVVDTREQAPFHFRDMKADKKEGGGTLIVPTVRKGLKTGDYSIDGHENGVAIERKSLEDLFHCVGSDRERFEKQLSRLDEMPVGAMMIEADWARVLRGTPQSQLLPKTVVRSVIAWQQDYYPGVHWWFVPGRRAAEVFTFRILQRFWKKRVSV